MLRTIDLFAGCGGMSLGFQRAGFEIIEAFELWSSAVKCYRANFSHPVRQFNLTNVDEAINVISALKPEVIIGGPPCQDFSHAGKRVEAGRASLTSSFSDIVCAVKPVMFVMENVDRARNSNAYARARDAFKSAGYGLTEIVLDASLCGVPQKRKRFFCIGHLYSEDGFLGKQLSSQLNEKEMTLRDYFGDSLGLDYYYRHPRNYNRRAIFSIDEPAPTMRGVNRPVPGGYPGHPNDASQLNESIRALTPLERALVQTFPGDFKWVGSRTDMELMVGNAVPVKLAEFVAKALISHYNNQSTAQLDFAGFVDWLGKDINLSKRTCSDMASRLRRADSIFPLYLGDKDFYLFKLERDANFQSLPPSVKSQLKRAVNLYAEYNAK